MPWGLILRTFIGTLIGYIVGLVLTYTVFAIQSWWYNRRRRKTLKVVEFNLN